MITHTHIRKACPHFLCTIHVLKLKQLVVFMIYWSRSKCLLSGGWKKYSLWKFIGCMASFDTSISCVQNSSNSLSSLSKFPPPSLPQSGRRSERSSSHSSAKEFVFDHSYWSVNVGDDNFVDQERVSRVLL